MKFFPLLPILLGGAMLALTSRARATDATGSAPALVSPAASTPTPADLAWKDCQAAYGELLGKKEEAGPFFSAVETKLQKFIANYPKDIRHWKAQVDFANVGRLRLSSRAEPSPELAALARLYQNVIDDPVAPFSIRTIAAEEKNTLFAKEGARLITQAMADYDRQIASFRAELIDKKVPANGSLSDLIFGQSDAHKLYDNTRDEEKFLENLARDSNPNVADFAQGAQRKFLQQAQHRFAPLDLNFTAVDGRPIDLTKMRGKVILLQFWATWCGPCVGEMPTVQKVYTDYHTKGFEVVGISLDQDRSTLLSYLKVHNIPWPQFFDGKAFDNQISQSFGIYAVPALWLFDQNGMFIDEVYESKLEPKVAELLAKNLKDHVATHPL